MANPTSQKDVDHSGTFDSTFIREVTACETIYQFCRTHVYNEENNLYNGYWDRAYLERTDCLKKAMEKYNIFLENQRKKS